MLVDHDNSETNKIVANVSFRTNLSFSLFKFECVGELNVLFHNFANKVDSKLDVD